jgi:hypothetical protein
MKRDGKGGRSLPVGEERQSGMLHASKRGYNHLLLLIPPDRNRKNEKAVKRYVCCIRDQNIRHGECDADR